MKIHKTAIVSPEAKIGNNVEIGPYSIIEDDVIIQDNTKILSNVLIASGTRIDKNCKIFHGAVLGTIPQDLKFAGEKTTLEIGSDTVIREYATLNRGTVDRRKTVIGSNCFIMAYAHIAHDCMIGNNVIIANAVNMAGHITIEDYVGIGGMVPIHQFVKIGTQTFIGGGYRVPKDVPPYILAAGEPLRYAGLNSVGLNRRGIRKDVQSALKKAYRYIYRSNLNLNEALDKIEQEIDPFDEIKHLVSFIKHSERGIIR
jgi:UDP-N-acetylglucosamine acyltransferase